MNLGQTNLVTTSCLFNRSQVCLWREERSQLFVMVALTDTKTGEKGHLMYGIEVDKRDIEDHAVFTDNPKLFADNLVEPFELQTLFELKADTKLSEDEIDEIMGSCWENELEYRSHPVSGVYPINDPFLKQYEQMTTE